jgi:hypothetical protein
VPSRRDRKKAAATATPLASLATEMPDRDRDFDAEDLVAVESPAPAAMPAPELDDDMLPESTATMPVVGAETDTTPANVRARPGARKIATRTELPDVPRTIAEMQAQDEGGTVFLAEEEEELPPPEPLFVSPQELLIGAVVPFLIVTLSYVLIDLLCRAAHLPDSVRNVVNFIAIGVSAIVALWLGIRNWRIAFHDVPTDLHPRSIIDLWQRRGTGPQRDMWVSASLWIIAGFVFLLLFTLVFAPFSYGLSAAYFIPYLLLVLLAKAVGAFLFVGYFERGMLALAAPGRAGVITGVVYGLALMFINAVTIASREPSAIGVMLTYSAISLFVGLAAAWIRLRTGSILAAIAFQLLLLLLGFQV